VSLRRRLVDYSIADTTGAADEVAAYFRAALLDEATRAFAKLSDGYTAKMKIVIDRAASRERTPEDSAIIAGALLAEYNRERARIEHEVYAKAAVQAVIVAKIRGGAAALDAVERMDVIQEQAEKELALRMLKEAAGAIGKFGVPAELTDMIGRIATGDKATPAK
jgi:2,3-bisphosphoglycerate-independent phosphoglycerate mutase